MEKNDFILECKNIGIDIDENIFNKLNEYYTLLKEWNEKINLTTIIEKKDVFLKHFYDSLCVYKQTKLDSQSICDFGTGAGFPGMVLAIVFKNTKVTLIEANGKKCLFLNEVKNNLNLKNVSIINDRIEDYAKINREIFDIVLCRAVSSMGIILELSSALVKINGFFIAMKSHIEEENYEKKDFLEALGYEKNNMIEYYLPVENSKRTLLRFIKTRKTSEKYPRNYNIILKDNKKNNNA